MRNRACLEAEILGQALADAVDGAVTAALLEVLSAGLRVRQLRVQRAAGRVEGFLADRLVMDRVVYDRSFMRDVVRRNSRVDRLRASARLSWLGR